MDSFELSKIAGAVLSALLLICLPKTLVNLINAEHGHGPGVKAVGYTLAAAAPAAHDAGGSTPAAAAAFDPAAVVAKMATAKPENGAASFKKCLGCHSAEKGAANKVGPNLWGVLGRHPGSVADYAGYSEAMKGKASETWSYANLATFVHAPKSFVPGTKMMFSGIPDPQDVADLLAYIRTLSDAPVALP